MLLKLIPDNTNIGFVRLRWWAFGLTIALTIGSLALIGVRGLNLGVDFVGGQLIQARFVQPVPLDTLRATVATVAEEASLQQFGDANTVAIRLPAQDDADAMKTTVERVREAVARDNPGVRVDRGEGVSGEVSGELIRTGLLAVAFALVGIAVFTWFRFEWHFGVSTLAALVHDVTVILGFFALTQLEVDLNIVAAVLTIIGYSLNDKIVVDDRIRENLRKYRKMAIGDLIDLSVNETLSRTVVTSVSLILALGALVVLGPNVIFGFAVAMLLGIVVGTYSSIFVSSSLLISLGLTSDSFAPAAGAMDRPKVSLGKN